MFEFLNWVSSLSLEKKHTSESSFEELYSDNVMTEENSSQGGGMKKKKESSMLVKSESKDSTSNSVKKITSEKSEKPIAPKPQPTSEKKN